MKRYLIAIAMVLALSMNAGAAAQKHRHTPRTEQVDTTQNKQDAIEAYSDTTSSDTISLSSGSSVTWQTTNSISDEDAKVLREVFGGLGEIIGPGIALGVVAIVVIFLLLPLIIIIAIFYFVNRNRRERYKLAQMAMQNGQPIPDEVFKNQPNAGSDDYQSGIRQMFLGIGLAIFLGFTAGKVGLGIGALVFFIGLGKWIIARQQLGDGNGSFNGPVNNSNNNSNIQNYD